MKFTHLIKALLLSLVLSFSLLNVAITGSVQQAHAENATDPAPSITHTGTLKGKVLFDNTHGETAGNADWVIDGGFSDFANAIAGQGYDVNELRQTTPITYDELKNYNVFVLGESNIPFKQSEQNAMLQYVQNGGSIFFIADHYNSDRNLNRWDSGEAYNGYRRGAWTDPTKGMSTEEANSAAMQGVVSSDWLGQNFGVRFRTNALGDITSGETVVSPSQSFGITQGVTTVEMHAGSTLAILDNTKAKGLIYMPTNPPAWPYAVDQGVYDNGGIAEGAFAAIAKVGQGKAAFLGDSSPVEDSTPKYLREDNGATKTTYDGFSTEGQDSTYLINVINWLATQENYTSFDQVSGLQLSQQTTLLSFEIPQNSTEPQTEPWSTPPAGYKWYDASTFKTGSYGAGSTSTGGSGTGPTDLFISEYDEGSSYNKAIEIYNGTGSTVDLSGYTLNLSNVSTPINLSGTITSGDVYVVANPNATQAILSVSDAVDSNLAFNGNDSVTLEYNGTPIDVVGVAGTTFGQDETLVRKSTIANGTTTYDSTQWDVYPQDTFSYLGSHTGPISSTTTTTLNEDFENGTKGAYASGTVTLGSGSWTFNNALIGNLSSDQKNGSQSARIRSLGTIEMNFDVSGAQTVKVSVANFGSDTGATWKLQKSTDSGATWQDVSNLASATSTLTENTISVNQTGQVRFRIDVEGTSGDRINVDDFKILN